MHELYPELPKVTGIAMDLFFDHLLAKHWGTYHSIDLEVYLDRFYSYKPEAWEYYTPEFRNFIGQMRKYRWINYYNRPEGLEKASQGVSSRISFNNKLPDAPKIFLLHQDKILKCFEEYMADAIPYFEKLNLPSV
jgi:acyl carrier protein phosphodiesterase